MNCKKCGNVLRTLSAKIRPRTTFEEEKQRSPFFTKGDVTGILKALAIAILGGFILIALFVIVLSRRDRAISSQAASSRTSSFSAISVGQEAHLNTETGVAFTPSALDALVRASTAHDLVGYKQIFLKGQAILVDANTRVLVIDSGFSTAKVRVLEGPFKDQAGWVNREFVSR